MAAEKPRVPQQGQHGAGTRVTGSMAHAVTSVDFVGAGCMHFLRPVLVLRLHR